MALLDLALLLLRQPPEERPGGLHLVALSHRCFPTKAIRAWHVLPPRERLDVVRTYFLIAGGYDEPEISDCSPAGADPLWVVRACLRSEAHA